MQKGIWQVRSIGFLHTLFCFPSLWFRLKECEERWKREETVQKLIYICVSVIIMKSNKRHSTSFYSLSTSSDIYLSNTAATSPTNASLDSFSFHGDLLTDLPNIKLLLIGDANVGKTAIILRFCDELPTKGQLRQLKRSRSLRGSIINPSLVTSPLINKEQNVRLRSTTKNRRREFNGATPTGISLNDGDVEGNVLKNRRRRRKDFGLINETEERKRYSSTDFDEFNKRRSLLFTNNYSSLFNEQLKQDPTTTTVVYNNRYNYKYGGDDDDDDDDDDDEIMLYTQSTIGVDIKTRLINVDNRFFNCTFWDTAGQERYRNALIPSLYKNCNAIILTYDITNWQSFQDCFQIWLIESLKYIPTDQLRRCRIYLIGNKIDLYPNRQVTHQDILKSIHQVEKRLNVKIHGNFEVTCKWRGIINDIINSIIVDLISNGCYQDVRGVQSDDIDYSNDNNRKILPDEEDNIETIRVKDDLSYSTSNGNNKDHHYDDKLSTSIIDITKSKEMKTPQTEYSCCM